jgi:hypothetical protein
MGLLGLDVTTCSTFVFPKSEYYIIKESFLLETQSIKFTCLNGSQFNFREVNPLFQNI